MLGAPALPRAHGDDVDTFRAHGPPVGDHVVLDERRSGGEHDRLLGAVGILEEDGGRTGEHQREGVPFARIGPLRAGVAREVMPVLHLEGHAREHAFDVVAHQPPTVGGGDSAGVGVVNHPICRSQNNIGHRNPPLNSAS